MKNKCKILFLCRDVIFTISVRFRKMVLFKICLLIFVFNSSLLPELYRFVLLFSYPSHSLGLMLLAGDISFFNDWRSWPTSLEGCLSSFFLILLCTTQFLMSLFLCNMIIFSLWYVSIVWCSQLRGVMDPKMHYKRSDSNSKTLPKYFQASS
jgi:hypothetical protein